MALALVDELLLHFTVPHAETTTPLISPEFKTDIKYLLNHEKYQIAKDMLLNRHLNHISNIWLLFHLGYCCFMQQKYSIARQCFEKCIAIQPKNVKHRFWLAQTYQTEYDCYDSLQTAESICKDCWMTLIENDSKYSDEFKINFYNLWAQLLTRLQNNITALCKYQQIFHIIDKTNSYAHHFIHYQYAILLDKSVAVSDTNLNQKEIFKHFQIAIDLKPNEQQYYRKSKEILLKRGQRLKCVQLQTRASTGHPTPMSCAHMEIPGFEVLINGIFHSSRVNLK